jgi:hypothetical protein
MQVNIAILVMACSLRAENTTANSQSSTAAGTNLTTAATQITVLFCRVGGLFLYPDAWRRCTVWVLDIHERLNGHRPVLKPWTSP